MVRRRRFLLLLALAVIAALAVGLWAWLDGPPPLYVLRYGFLPSGGPTGRKITVEGVEFIELSPGYIRVGTHFFCGRGNLWGRIGSTLGIPWGTRPRHGYPTCPPRWIEVPEPIWVARTELTNAQYQRYYPEWDDFDYPNRPIVNLTIQQATWYCRWLSERTEGTVRLPTGEEWEFACRAGSLGEFAWGDDSSRVSEFAWTRENVTDGMEQEVGTLEPNRWGLFDMHGNLLEWCSDATQRGGAWGWSGDECVAGACQATMWVHGNNVGFRPVLVLAGEKPLAPAGPGAR